MVFVMASIMAEAVMLVEWVAADAAARDELVHFPKPMAVAPARPALRAGPSITTMIGQESKCLRVCWALIIRRCRGRTGGHWGFVRLSPFLVSIKGRCPSLP
jgi:hypothetical protein